MASVDHDNDNRPVVATRNNQPLRFLSVCSGIEAASVAWHPLGWQAVAFSEIEKFPSAVLAHHYPDVPNLGDFTNIKTNELGRVDILCGGTPCQSFSVAGLRKGLEDERGNLTLAFVELAHELAAGNGLRNVVWENVPGVLSDRSNAFGCFLAGLVGAAAPIDPGGKWPSHGMVAGPKARAAWAIKDGQFFGVAQRRRRVIVVADFGIGADPAAVLFEPESLPRHTPPSREAGQKPAPTISARTKGGGGLGTDFDLDGGLVPSSYAPEIARCDATREGSSQDYETTTMVAQAVRAVSVTGDVAHTLKAEGADASEDGTGRGTPIVTYAQASAPSMVSNGDAHSGFRDENGLVAQAYSIMPQNSGKDYKARPVEVAQPLMAGGPVGGNQGGDFILQSAVRRLTPVECERLQGFPDGYTDIPWRGKPTSPDGPRYKALGNSWAVPKFAWLGRRIAALMPALPATATNDNKDTSLAA